MASGHSRNKANASGILSLLNIYSTRSAIIKYVEII